MPNKPWSQAEENQLVGSLPAGNSIELIATNLSRSTNEVFSRAIGARVALAALLLGLPVDFFSVLQGHWVNALLLAYWVWQPCPAPWMQV